MPGKTKLSQSQIDEIVAWAERKKWGTWIARRMGLPAATVTYQMLTRGFDPWRPERAIKAARKGAFSPAEDARMLELGRAGNRIGEIARVMKRSRTSIRIRTLTLEVRAEKALEAA